MQEAVLDLGVEQVAATTDEVRTILRALRKTGYDAAPIEYWGEAGSFGFFKQHIATGWVRGPFDLYGGFSAVGLEGYRDHAQQQRYRLNTSTGWDFGGGMTARFDVGMFVAAFARHIEHVAGR